MQLPLTPWLWHISSAEQELRPFHLPGSEPDFGRKAASGHSVCTCNPAQAFPSLQMLLLLMLVSHFLHHLLLLQLSQLPTLFTFLSPLLRASAELLLCVFSPCSEPSEFKCVSSHLLPHSRLSGGSTPGCLLPFVVAVLFDRGQKTKKLLWFCSRHP